MKPYSKSILTLISIKDSFLLYYFRVWCVSRVWELNHNDDYDVTYITKNLISILALIRICKNPHLKLKISKSLVMAIYIFSSKKYTLSKVSGILKKEGFEN